MMPLAENLAEMKVRGLPESKASKFPILGWGTFKLIGRDRSSGSGDPTEVIACVPAGIRWTDRFEDSGGQLRT